MVTRFDRLVNTVCAYSRLDRRVVRARLDVMIRDDVAVAARPDLVERRRRGRAAQ